MDKGLDIDTVARVIAWHTALSSRPRDLARLAASFSTETPRSLQLARRLETVAANLSLSPDWGAAKRALTWLDDPAHHLLTIGDPNYPQRLHEIPCPPPLLYVNGRVSLLARPQIAVVGSRKASPAGCAVATQLARELADNGLLITSGLALGIDASAHRAALAAGAETIAVFGCGVDRIYPARHRQLAASVAAQGALISEFPLGTRPKPHHFPQRNRIIAGLSLGTVVIEAAERSGSISTANHALEQGREVFAVPGSVLNPLSRGCHALLKAGAKVTENAADVLAELTPEFNPQAQSRAAKTKRQAVSGELDEASTRFLEACTWEPCSIDELVQRSGLTVPEVCSMLLTLELAGALIPRNDGTWMRVR